MLCPEIVSLHKLFFDCHGVYIGVSHAYMIMTRQALMMGILIGVIGNVI